VDGLRKTSTAMLGQEVSWQRFENGTSRIQVCSATATPTCAVWLVSPPLIHDLSTIILIASKRTSRSIYSKSRARLQKSRKPSPKSSCSLSVHKANYGSCSLSVPKANYGALP